MKGQTKDTNTHFLTKRLKELGVKVRRVSVIPDDIDIIASSFGDTEGPYMWVYENMGGGNFDATEYLAYTNYNPDFFE